METLLAVLAVIGYVFFFLIMFVAILSILIGLPGCWVILVETLVYCLIPPMFHKISMLEFAVLLLMALAGELFEFLITAYGAKKFGASNKAVIAALAGGLIGAILVNNLFPIIGALVGAFAGVYLGAFLYTYLADRELGKAAKAGIGAFMGRMGAVLVKGTMAIAISGFIISQMFFIPA